MVKKLINFKTIKVFCKCWEVLVKYRKWPWRRLLKIHRDRIVKDYNNVFINDKSDMWTDIFCLKCKCCLLHTYMSYLLMNFIFGVKSVNLSPLIKLYAL